MGSDLLGAVAALLDAAGEGLFGTLALGVSAGRVTHVALRRVYKPHEVPDEVREAMHVLASHFPGSSIEFVSRGEEPQNLVIRNVVQGG